MGEKKRSDDLPPGWPRDRMDLQEDWNRAMRGYKPSIWDPYKGEVDRVLLGAAVVLAVVIFVAVVLGAVFME